METSNSHSQYRMAAEPVNGFGRPVSGRYLAHARLTPAEWAYLAADLYNGRRFLVKPTMVQAAWLARKISTTYAHTALRRPDERWLVENGHLPLVMPRTRSRLRRL